MAKYAQNRQLNLFNGDNKRSDRGSFDCLTVTYSADSDNFDMEIDCAIERLGYNPQLIFAIPVDLDF